MHQGEALYGHLTGRLAQTQAWLIPEPDAGLVQIQSHDRFMRRYLTQQEAEPLPHSGRLGGQKRSENGFRVWTPLPYCF